jgi:hypothetical protein
MINERLIPGEKEIIDGGDQQHYVPKRQLILLQPSNPSNLIHLELTTPTKFNHRMNMS